MSTVTWRVGDLAAQRGFGVRRLAEEAGLDEKTVRNIVAGRATRVDLETIARLARALNVAPGALWEFRPESLDAWTRTAGSAGQADAVELEGALDGGFVDQLNSGLERATR